jgi:hypothetical protein
MFLLEYPLAVALLTAPAGGPVPDASLIFSPGLRPALQELALAWEILDERETGYVLTRPENFAHDLELLRRRYRELADAPPLSDCQRFPDRQVVGDLRAFNRAYRQHLTSRQAVELARWWELREAIQETDRLYAVWDAVGDACRDSWYVTVRRQALKRLRGLLGPEVYAAGKLPPAVPVWRFQSVD